jgi:hypothetical protein
MNEKTLHMRYSFLLYSKVGYYNMLVNPSEIN